MNIKSISKKDKEVIVSLSSDELVKLGNVLYNAKEEDKNRLYYKLYGEIIIARDLSQYGQIDGFSFERIAKCREKIKEFDNKTKEQP